MGLCASPVHPLHRFQVRRELNAVKEGNAHFGELYIFEKHLCFDLKALSHPTPYSHPRFAPPPSPPSPPHPRRRRASCPAGVCFPQAVGPRRHRNRGFPQVPGQRPVVQCSARPSIFVVHFALGRMPRRRTSSRCRVRATHMSCTSPSISMRRATSWRLAACRHVKVVGGSEAIVGGGGGRSRE